MEIPFSPDGFLHKHITDETARVEDKQQSQAATTGDKTKTDGKGKQTQPAERWTRASLITGDEGALGHRATVRRLTAHSSCWTETEPLSV